MSFLYLVVRMQPVGLFIGLHFFFFLEVNFLGAECIGPHVRSHGKKPVHLYIDMCVHVEQTVLRILLAYSKPQTTTTVNMNARTKARARGAQQFSPRL